MLNIELNDYTGEDVKQLNELKRMGVFTEDELQMIYDRTQNRRKEEEAK